MNRRPRSPLSVEQYVRRATLGLPKGERLDAAAELRTHLLERVADYQMQGFDREEAEFLAVRGMGEPGVTNRELLGHFLTTPLGWGVLAALIVGWVGWQLVRPGDDLRIHRGEPVGVNSFSNGGSLPTFYTARTFKTPPGTRFVEIAWAGTLGEQRAMLPALAGTSGEVVHSWPTWREWWGQRTPLPQADLPWRETCRDQQPVHVQLQVQSTEKAVAGWKSSNSQADYEDGGRPMGLGLKRQDSNLNGLLWCSGLALPPTQKGARIYGGGSSSQGAYVDGSVVEVNHWDGQTDRGRMRLNHWTLLYLDRQDVRAEYAGRQVKEIRGTAAFFIRPSDTAQQVPLPTVRYTPQTDTWEIHELPPR